jgi:DNA-binding MarR family transcriptional regulator
MVSMSTNANRDAWRAMNQIMFDLGGQGKVQCACSRVGVSPGLMKMLFVLKPGKGVPMRELADLCQCDASYVTNVVDDLEKRGLVERQPHPTDRRVKMVVLTDAGAAMKSNFDELCEPPCSFGVLTPAEQRQLRDLLRKVADSGS